MEKSREKLHWEAACMEGLTGKGVTVAVLDTGIFPHEDLRDRIAGFYDVLGKSQIPYDDNGHGTHVCGIIGGDGHASDGRFCGMAPGCRLVMVKVLDSRGGGYVSDIINGLVWIRHHRRELGIRIVNISVGSCSRKNMSENSALVRAVDAAWDDGLVVVAAAGNNGPGPRTVTTPGISRKVITVGCADDGQAVRVMGKRKVDYSGRGPTGACVCKPEILAPGAGIISCLNEPGRYSIKSGTSMSTPMVSGAIALLLEKYPDMSNRDVKLRLRERALDLGFSRNYQGWGLLDVERLVRTE